jgi:hypothetical protein
VSLRFSVKCWWIKKRSICEEGGDSGNKNCYVEKIDDRHTRGLAQLEVLQVLRNRIRLRHHWDFDPTLGAFSRLNSSYVTKHKSA